MDTNRLIREIEDGTFLRVREVARRHLISVAMELSEHVELGKGEARSAREIPDFADHQFIASRESDPYAGAVLFHESTAVASISTLASGSSSALTSTSAMAG